MLRLKMVGFGSIFFWILVTKSKVYLSSKGKLWRNTIVLCLWMRSWNLDSAFFKLQWTGIRSSRLLLAIRFMHVSMSPTNSLWMKRYGKRWIFWDETLSSHEVWISWVWILCVLKSTKLSLSQDSSSLYWSSWPFRTTTGLLITFLISSSHTPSAFDQCILSASITSLNYSRIDAASNVSSSSMVLRGL